MAWRMDTSRNQLDQLLDPNRALTLEILTRAARSIARQVKLEIVSKAKAFKWRKKTPRSR